jgi:CHAD domain-containing protein
MISPSAQELTPDNPLWAWAQQAILARTEDVFKETDRVREGEDIEGVHDMRVASRRLVAAMKVFAVCFPGPRFESLLKEARGVTRRLGAVRDLDVLIDHYEKLRPSTTGPEELAAEYFIAVRHRERDKARKPLLRALDEMEKDRLARRVHREVELESDAYRVGLNPPLGRNRTVDPAASFRAAAPPILEDRLDTLLSFEPYVDDPNEVEQLHEMRIAAKWLRYTLELFAPAYANVLKGQINAVKRVQELLGDLHDSDVRLDLLRGMLEGPPDLRGLEAVGLLLPDQVQAGLGLLLAREAQERRGYYSAFHKEWSRQRKKDFARKTRDRIRRPDGGLVPAAEAAREDEEAQSA